MQDSPFWVTGNRRTSPFRARLAVLEERWKPACGNAQAQGARPHPKTHRRLPGHIAVELHRQVRRPHLDFASPVEVQPFTLLKALGDQPRGKRQPLPGAARPHRADVEQAVIRKRIRREFHNAPVETRVTNDDETPFPGVGLPVDTQIHRGGSEVGDASRPRNHIGEWPGHAFQPGRHARGNVRVPTDPGHEQKDIVVRGTQVHGDALTANVDIDRTIPARREPDLFGQHVRGPYGDGRERRLTLRNLLRGKAKCAIAPGNEEELDLLVGCAPGLRPKILDRTGHKDGGIDPMAVELPDCRVRIEPARMASDRIHKNARATDRIGHLPLAPVHP